MVLTIFPEKAGKYTYMKGSLNTRLPFFLEHQVRALTPDKTGDKYYLSIFRYFLFRNTGGLSLIKKEHIPLITIEGLLFLGVRLHFTQVRSI